MRNKLLIGVGIVGIGYIAWRHYRKMQTECTCKKKDGAYSNASGSITRASISRASSSSTCGTCTKSPAPQCLSGYILDSNPNCKCIGCATATEVSTNSIPTSAQRR
jgi:hypothetical protein